MKYRIICCLFVRFIYLYLYWVLVHLKAQILSQTKKKILVFGHHASSHAFLFEFDQSELLIITKKIVFSH